ncbi:MAG: hypothetical protein NVS3B6_14900 [Pseudarthrobacter sp.]
MFISLSCFFSIWSRNGEGGQHVTVDSDVHVGPPPQPVGRPVHLGGAGFRQELVVGKVGAQQDEQVRVLNPFGSGAVAQQAGHPDVEGVVVLDEVLAAERVADRRVDQFRERNQFVVGALHAGTGEDRHSPRLVDRIGQLLHAGGVGRQRGAPERGRQRRRCGRFQARDIAGAGYDGDTPEAECMLDGAVHHTRCLLGGAHHFRVDGAFVEKPVRMGFLEEAAADLLAGNVRGDGQHRSSRPVRVVQAVYQVQVAGPAGSGADCEFPRQLGLGRSSEGGGLLVPDVDPVDPAGLGTSRLPDGVDDRVQAVAHNPIDPLHPGSLELLDELVGEFLGHECTLPRSG